MTLLFQVVMPMEAADEGSEAGRGTLTSTEWSPAAAGAANGRSGDQLQQSQSRHQWQRRRRRKRRRSRGAPLAMANEGSDSQKVQ